MELNDKQLKKLLELADFNSENYELSNISSEDISKALINIEQKLSYFDLVSLDNIKSNFNILIVDDLELSIFQLTKLLNKIGVVPSIARSANEALDLINKKTFDYILVDLFLPNYTDGLELMQKIQNFKEQNNRNYKIIAVSSTDDNNLINKVFKIGVDTFIPKSKNWHMDILSYIDKSMKNIDFKFFTKKKINDNTYLYKVFDLLSNKAISELLNSINLMILLDIKFILMDLSNISEFDKEQAGIFAQIYKNCVNKSGSLVLINPTETINQALNFAFLNGLIHIAPNLEEALDIVNS